MLSQEMEEVDCAVVYIFLPMLLSYIDLLNKMLLLIYVTERLP